MSLCLGIMALGGLLYVRETNRPVTYLKQSRKARRKITLLKYLIILGAIALIIASQLFFIDNLIL